jgi:hypothetical protein
MRNFRINPQIESEEEQTLMKAVRSCSRVVAVQVGNREYSVSNCCWADTSPVMAPPNSPST